MTTLLTDAARDWVGFEYPSKEFTVTRQDILKFAYATEEQNPIHLSRDAAVAAGYRDLVAPPLFHFAVRTAAYHIAPLEEFALDGTPSDDLPPIETIRGMGGEVDVALSAPIIAGDELVITKRVHDVHEKSGRSGPLVFVTFAFTITNQSGDVIVDEKFTRVFR